MSTRSGVHNLKLTASGTNTEEYELESSSDVFISRTMVLSEAVVSSVRPLKFTLPKYSKLGRVHVACAVTPAGRFCSVPASSSLYDGHSACSGLSCLLAPSP